MIGLIETPVLLGVRLADRVREPCYNSKTMTNIVEYQLYSVLELKYKTEKPVWVSILLCKWYFMDGEVEAWSIIPSPNQ